MGIREPLVASAPLLNFKKHLNRTILEISYTTAQDLHDKGLKISIHSTSSPFYMNRRLRSPVSHSGNVRLLGECQGKLESNARY